MKNDKLSQLWESQKNDLTFDNPESIVKKAQKQRNGQFITIAVLTITVIILIAYAITYVDGSNWNNFNLGVMLMISSLTFRLILEYFSIYRKKSQLISLDNRSFEKYLKKYYGMRLKINYIITPICFGIYVFGFTRLLPYFKNEFSEGFYKYILISGIVSLIGISVLIAHSVIKEQGFLKQLNKK